MSFNKLCEKLRALDTLDLLILYLLYYIDEKLSRKLMHKLLAYALLVDPHERVFKPIDLGIGKMLRVKHFGWVFNNLTTRLGVLESLGLVDIERIGVKRLYAKPKLRNMRSEVLEAVKRILEERGFPFDRFAKALSIAIEIYRRSNVVELARDLEEITGIAGTKFALVNIDASTYFNLVKELQTRSRDVLQRYPQIPSIEEFEDLRRQIKEPIT